PGASTLNAWSVRSLRPRCAPRGWRARRRGCERRQQRRRRIFSLLSRASGSGSRPKQARHSRRTGSKQIRADVGTGLFQLSRFGWRTVNFREELFLADYNSDFWRTTLVDKRKPKDFCGLCGRMKAGLSAIIAGIMAEYFLEPL